MNMFLVQSPFQFKMAINFIENKRNLKKARIIVRLIKNNKRQYSDSLSFCKLNDHKVSFIDEKFSFPVFLFIGFLSKFFTSLYVGDIRSVYFNLVTQRMDPKKVYVLDDGAATFGIVDLLSKKKKLPILNGTEKIKYWKKKFFGVIKLKFINVNIEKFTYYTIFNVDKNIENVHLIPYLHNKTTSNEKNSPKNNYFLGGKYCEIGIMPYEHYLSAIRDALDVCSNLYYIPHRAESEVLLKRIKKDIPKIKIISIDMPVEDYFINKNITPKSIYSIYSTALFTLSSIFQNETSIYYRKININIAPEIHKAAINSVYKELHQTNNVKDY